MWQPTNSCMGRCSGCYVRASNSSHYRGPVKTDVVHYIYETGQLECQQFTISLDTIHPKNIPTNLIDALRTVWLKTLERQRMLKEVLEADYKPQPSPMLCVTAHSYEDITRWAEALGFTTPEFLQPLGMLSLSKFPSDKYVCETLKKMCKQLSVTLNYNRVIKCDVEEDKNLPRGCEFADSVYLILHKQPLGDAQDLDMLDYWIDAFKELPDSTMGELIPDTCIYNAVNKEKNGFSCSAGISKVQVWPDGSVTGCPYDAKHIMTPVKNEYDTWMELQTVLDTREHPMRRCTIQEALKELQRESKRNC